MMRLFLGARGGILLMTCLVAGCLADERQDDGGLDPSAGVATVVISPSSVSIVSNEVVQFEIYGITMAGDSVSVVLDWEANGGAVGPNGTFSASSGGTYMVIGRGAWDPFPADTVMVNVITEPLDLSHILITPEAPIIAPGGTRPFLADGVYSDSSIRPVSVSWSATGGTIDAGGNYTAGSTEGSFQVVASSGPVTDTVAVTINSTAPTVQKLVLTPDTAVVRPGATTRLQAYGYLTDGSVSPVTAAYLSTTGTITSSGLLTAGSLSGSYRVIALSSPDGNADTSTILISNSTVSEIRISPPSVALQFGSSITFSATAELVDGSSAAVAIVYEATGGTITTGGLYTAGNAPGTYSVIALNVASGLADTASVSITAPASELEQVILEPPATSLIAGGTQQFSARGVLTDGSTVDIPVNFTATGGTINSNGFYQAPTVTGNYEVIATALVGGKADTSGVTVSAANSLVSISVTPQTAQILTGGIQQFAAIGNLSGGGTSAVTVTWSTDGGSISSTGTYTANNTPGTYTVIATTSGGLADTATVTTINLPPPGSNACTFEPTGYTPISTQAFGSKPPNSPSEDAAGWNIRASDGFRLRAVTDGTAPKSPSGVLEGVFPAGFRGGAAPFRADRDFDRNYSEVYVCLFTRLDPLYTNNGNTGTKFGFILTPYHSGSTGLNHYFNLTNNLGVNLQSAGGVLNRNMHSSFSLVGHRGTWHKIEFLVIGNSLGKSDGVARMWVNGAQVLDVNNVQFFYPSQPPAFNGITWNPTYGGGHNPVPYDMRQWIDNWYISGR